MHTNILQQLYSAVLWHPEISLGPTVPLYASDFI